MKTDDQSVRHYMNIKAFVSSTALKCSEIMEKLNADGFDSSLDLILDFFFVVSSTTHKTNTSNRNQKFCAKYMNE